MFFEDINSIYEKYKYLSFWYEISYDEIINNTGKYVDFIEITNLTPTSDNPYINLKIPSNNSFWTGFVIKGGSRTGDDYFHVEIEDITFWIDELYEGETLKFLILVDKQYETYSYPYPTFIARDSLIFVRDNTQGWSRKVYIDFTDDVIEELEVGSLNYDSQGEWVISKTTKTVQEDTNGYYVTPYYTSTMNEIFYISDGDDTSYLGKIVIVPQLPQITYDTLYKGNKQHIQLYFDGTEIDDKYYSIIYGNEVLKDNIIQVPTNKDSIDIKISLNHPAYIKTTLDYSIPIDYYYVDNATDWNWALENNLNYLNMRIDDSNFLTNAEIKDMHLIGPSNNHSMVLQKGSKLENCIIENIYIEVIETTAENTIFNECKIYGRYALGLVKGSFNDCELNNCNIRYLRMILNDCKLENNTIHKCLLLSDSDNISIINNTFTNVYDYADYFPNTLYLTGDFECRGNTFTQSKTFSELNFNVALLKTIHETDINKFIASNTFNLNNTVEGTTYTGLFYNLVDDDSLIYKEVD